MKFYVGDTFTDSLKLLAGDEQKVVKTTAFDLQSSLSHPSNCFHRIERAKDPNFWSVRANDDIRLIVHKTEDSLLLCYVDHHDKAYDWAERRKVEIHPKTGAIQIVEIKQTVREVPVYKPKEKPPEPRKVIFAHLTDEELLSYGVPEDWLDKVRNATEESFFEFHQNLPAEASEALLEVAAGKKPKTTGGDKKKRFEHPDTQRRFRLMANFEELERALDYPWDKWSVFLHPEQRQLVEKSYNGPARVCGSAGTGKTIVAVHRAVFLARANPNTRVLLTTFSNILANSLKTKLRRLIGNEPQMGERLEVHSIDAIGGKLYKANFGVADLASPKLITEVLSQAAKEITGHKFSAQFLQSEWEEVVDTWDLNDWDRYRDVARLGRKTRLKEPQRLLLWKIFEKVRAALVDKKKITRAGVFSKLATKIKGDAHPPFDFIIVDEAQDIGVAHLKFLISMARRPDALYFAGDLGQRIFQQPFSWKTLGVDVRGRSKSLRVNYRTSHQIRTQADRLLGPEVADADGNAEKRDDTISVFNGPVPKILEATNAGHEQSIVAEWVESVRKGGVALDEIAIIVRSEEQLQTAIMAAVMGGKKYHVLDESVATMPDQLSICTMHLAKGMEFKAVAVMACNDDVIPLKKRIEQIGDDSDLKEVYDTERHLLYVACTRARDQLLLTSTESPSEFLDDMLGDTSKPIGRK